MQDATVENTSEGSTSRYLYALRAKWGEGREYTRYTVVSNTSHHLILSPPSVSQAGTSVNR